MEKFASDLIALLQFLLPGFITAWLVYSLTSRQKPSQFERIIEALILTFFVRLLLVPIEGIISLVEEKVFSFVSWNKTSEDICSFSIAIVLGLIIAVSINKDILHGLLRNRGFSTESSFQTVWLSVFANKRSFVVLHFKDERRLRGWPLEWPSDPEKGHFLIELPAWYDSDKSAQDFAPVDEVDSILIDLRDVRWVEFVKHDEVKNAKDSNRSRSDSEAAKR